MGVVHFKKGKEKLKYKAGRFCKGGLIFSCGNRKKRKH